MATDAERWNRMVQMRKAYETGVKAARDTADMEAKLRERTKG